MMLQRSFVVALIATSAAASAPSLFSWADHQATRITIATTDTTNLASQILQTDSRLQAHRLKTPSRRKLCSPKQRCNDAIPIVITLNGENPYEEENNSDGIPETVQPNTNMIPSNRPTVIFNAPSTDIPTDGGNSLGIVTDGTDEGEEEEVNNANDAFPTPFPSAYLPTPQDQENEEVNPSVPNSTDESDTYDASHPVSGPTPVEAHLKYPVNVIYGKSSKIPVYGISSGGGSGNGSSSSSKSGKSPLPDITSGTNHGGDYSSINPGMMSMGYAPVASSPSNSSSSSKAGKLPSSASVKDDETSGDEGMNTIVMGNNGPSTSGGSYGGKASKEYGMNPSVPGSGALFGKSGKYSSGSSQGNDGNGDNGSGGGSTTASPLPTAKPTSSPTYQSSLSTASPTYEIQPIPETVGILVDTFPEHGDDTVTMLAEDGQSTPTAASPSYSGGKSGKYPISGGATIYIHGPPPSPSNTVTNVSYSLPGGKSGKPNSSNIAGSPSGSSPTATSSSSRPASSSVSGGKSEKYPIAGGSIIHVHGPGTSSPTSGNTATSTNTMANAPYSGGKSGKAHSSIIMANDYNLDDTPYLSGSKASKASPISSIGLIWDNDNDAINANVVGSSKSGKYSQLPDGYVQPNKPYPIGSGGSSSVPYFVYDNGSKGSSTSSSSSSKGMGVLKSAVGATDDFAWYLSSKSSKASLVSGTSICLEPGQELVYIKGSSKSSKTSTIITTVENTGTGARRARHLRRHLGGRNRHLSTKSAKSSSLSIFYVTDCQNEPVPSPVTDTLSPTQSNYPTASDFRGFPEANDDFAETTENQFVVIKYHNNDVIPEGSTVTYTEPSSGRLILTKDEFIYTPFAAFCGFDTFTYMITDSTGKFNDMATVTIHVKCAGDTLAPTAAATPPLTEAKTEIPQLVDDKAETTMNTPVSIPVLENDIYVPPNSAGSIDQPMNGTCSVEESGILYTPDPGFCGFDSFNYTITDASGTFSDTATCFVDVLCSGSLLPTTAPASQGPTLTDGPSEVPEANDDYVETNRDTPVIVEVLDNDVVPEGTTGSFTRPNNGTVKMENDDLLYQPDPGFCGFDIFSYTLQDEKKSVSDSAQVTVNVICSDGNSSPPTGAPTPMASGSEGLGDPKLSDDYFEGNPGDRVQLPVLNNDTVPADSSVDVTQPTNGSVLMDNETLVYIPNEGFCGFDSFSYTVTSPNNSFEETAKVTVFIQCQVNSQVPIDSLSPTVSPTPMASGSEIVGEPKLVNDYYEGNSGDRVPVPILDNDKYPDNSTIDLDEPSNGTLSMENNTLIYTPNEGFCGEDSFNYTVSVPAMDGSESITATATATVAISCDEGNGGGVVGDSLVPTVSPTPMASGSEIVGEPKLVNDYYEGNSGDRVPVPILDNDKYPANSTIDLDQPSNGTLSMENNTLIYTPNEGFCGEDSFNYTVSVPAMDGSAASSATATATATVVISCDKIDSNAVVEDSLSPTMSPTPMASGSEIVGEPKLVNDYYEGNSGDRVPVPILDNDKYPANSTIDLDEPSNGTLSMENNTLIYTPNEGFCGEDSFNYTVSVPAKDGSVAASATATVTVVILCDESDGDGIGDSGGSGGSGGGFIDNSLFPTVSPTPMASGSEIVGEPKLVNDYYEGNFGERVPVPILDNDKYPANSTIDLDDPSNGTLSMENNTLIYTPNEGFCGEDSFNYTVTNGFGQSATASSTITILCESDADDSETFFFVNDDFAQGNMGETIAIPVLANDTIPSNSTGFFTQPQNGVIIMNQDGLLYTPDSKFCGIDYFNYTVTGLDFEFTATAIVTVEITCDGVSLVPTPSPSSMASGSEAIGEPLAKDDFYQGNQGGRIEVPVLENDVFPDGSTGSYTQPANGTIESINNGTMIVYVPGGNFCGFDTFNYTITEPSSLSSSTGVVTIFVACEGQSLVPTASPTPSSTTKWPVLLVNADSALTGQNESVVIPVLENDLYPEGSSASFNQPGNGIIGMSKDGIVYEPYEGFCGPDSFNYTITDSTLQLTGTATVSVLVDCDVKANDDLAIVVGGSFVIIPVLDNDSYGTMPSADLSILSLSVPSRGIAEIAVGNVKYTPNPQICEKSISENVMDSFLYTIQNQVGATDFASVTVEICCTCEYSNNAPFVLNDAISTTFNTPVSVNVLDNDEDADGDDLKVTQIILDAVNGTCTISDNGQQVTYSPDKDFHGIDVCVYEACDDENECGDAEITVTVARNQGPIAMEDSATTTQGKSVLVNVLDNDYDNNGDELKVTSVTSASQGSCRVTGDSMSILYISDAFYVGEDSCVYTVCDTGGACDTADVVIEISPPNGEPIATNDEVSVPQDSGVVILNVLDNDEDSDGDQLTVDAILYDANNGVCAVHDQGSSVSYTPNSGYSGQDVCVYSVCDAKKSCDSAAVTIIIQAAPDENPTESPQNNSNTSPIAMDDFATTQEFEPIFVNVVTNDIDTEGDALSLSPAIISCKEGGSIQVVGDGSGGVVEYTPPIEFVGVDTCMYTVCDKSDACDSANLVVTVESAALPPIAENDDRETEKNSPINIYVTENDMSPENLPLAISGVQMTSQQGGSVSIMGNETSSYVLYQPPVDFVGNDQFSYSITDGSKNASGIVYIAVTLPKSVPLAKNDACTTSMNHSVLVYVLDNDDGTENASLTITSANNGLNGTCVALEAELIKYTPNPGYAGVDSCIYSVSDDSGSSSDAVLTITVLPVALPINISTESGEGTGIIVFSSLFHYPTFDVPGIRIVTDPVHGTVGPDESEVGTFVYTPEPGYDGTDSFEYEICTNNDPVLCAKSTVTITVIATADIVTNAAFPAQASPTALSDNTTTVMGVSVVTDVLANDFDPDDDELTIIEDSLIDGINGTCLIAGRNIEYIPSAGFVGVDTCTYSITDGRGGTDSAILAVTVFPLVKPMNETTDVDTPVAISVADSLESPNVDPSTGVKVYSAPSNGEVEVMNDGTLIYTPYAGFEGVDIFEYEICASNTPNLCSYSSASILVTTEFSGGSNDVPGFAFTDDEGEADSDDFIATSSYICNEVSLSEVIATRISFKYDLINNNEEDLETTIDLIELKLQNLLRKEVVCNGRRRLRHLSIKNMVGVNTNPPDKESDRTCISNKGKCFVIDAGITVFGDVDIEEVKEIIKTNLPAIVSEASGFNTSALNSGYSTYPKKSSQFEYVAIAGAAAVVTIGAALFIRQKTHKKIARNNLEEVKPWIKQKSSLRDIDTIDSFGVNAKQWPKSSFVNSSNTTPKKENKPSFFEEKQASPELIPISPANSIFSIPSSKSNREYNVEDTVDL